MPEAIAAFAFKIFVIDIHCSVFFTLTIFNLLNWLILRVCLLILLRKVVLAAFFHNAIYSFMGLRKIPFHARSYSSPKVKIFSFFYGILQTVITSEFDWLQQFVFLS